MWLRREPRWAIRGKILSAGPPAKKSSVVRPAFGVYSADMQAQAAIADGKGQFALETIMWGTPSETKCWLKSRRLGFAIPIMRRSVGKGRW